MGELDADPFRCDRPEVARRQLHLSVGLVLVLLFAALAMTVGNSRSSPSIADGRKPATGPSVVSLR